MDQIFKNPMTTAARASTASCITASFWNPTFPATVWNSPRETTCRVMVFIQGRTRIDVDNVLDGHRATHPHLNPVPHRCWEVISGSTTNRTGETIVAEKKKCLTPDTRDRGAG